MIDAEKFGDTYIPRIGHAIDAKRKVASARYANRIVGPVVDVWDNACRVLNNPGQSNEGDFRLYYSDWNISFLHEVKE